MTSLGMGLFFVWVCVRVISPLVVALQEPDPISAGDCKSENFECDLGLGRRFLDHFLARLQQFFLQPPRRVCQFQHMANYVQLISSSTGFKTIAEAV